MTRQEAIREETLRYVNACAERVALRDDPAAANDARRRAHIHLLALGRLRGQTVAPWIHQSDLHPTLHPVMHPTTAGGAQ
jgi:hypothetical protein